MHCMKIQLTVLLYLITSSFVMAELTPKQAEAKMSLEKVAKMEEYDGSIYAQARHDKIDYRPILKRAINLEKPALISLFGMQFMGEGGETHCEILKDLMILWGDEKFATVLGEQPKKVREIVVSSIDYAWADPSWASYPKTLALSPESVEAR
jgi:hypothetical protein